MLPDIPSWQPSRPYVCSPDAGPAWREAYETGLDMAELEENLRLTHSERLEKHERKLKEFLARESVLEELRRGLNFIFKAHGHPC